LGCRVSEALSLTVEDIDLIAGTVKIQHLKSRMRLGCPHCGTALGKKHSYCPGCGKKVAGVVNKEIQQQRMRTLPVDIETLNMLKEYINRGGPVIRNGKHIIFGISRHRSWQIVKECAEKAGLPRLVNSETGKLHNVSPHRLRDSFAVHAVKLNDSGDGLRLLQEHLGHQNFNTTAKYRKVSGKEHREWFNRLWKEDKP
jgi:integrase/recombinase XerD